jgi:hypothetical protein
MIECDACHRHFRLTEAGCPFCSKPWIPSSTVLNLLGGALTTFVLAACYGTAPADKPTTSGDTGATTGDTAGETTPSR